MAFKSANQEYDQNGNLTALKPPSRPAHNYVYNEVDLQTEYQAPEIGLSNHETLSSYNLDQQVTRITRPDNQVVDFNYDSGGRLTEIVLPKGPQTYTYDPNTGQVITVTDSKSGIVLSHSYDGSLLKSEQWSGNFSGRVNYGYNADFRMKSHNVNKLKPIAYDYDADALMIKAGDLTLNRDADNGLLKGTTLGKVNTTLTHNSFGELIDTTFQTIYANKTAEMAEELRDVQFSWEAVDDANVFAFSQGGEASAEAAKAFGAGLWTARESLLETRDITLPTPLLPPTPEDSWLKTEWAPYFDLGRWTLLLWTASEFPDERAKSFWDQQRAIFDDFNATFEARLATDNEAKKVRHQLNSRVKPHLEKLPAPDKPESYDELAVNLEKMMDFLSIFR